MKEILNIHQPHEVSDYPYGRLRTTAFFSVEFVPKKGFRHVFQTVNPKNGKLNKPKRSTYSTFAYNYRDGATGHIKEGAFSAYDFDSVNKISMFIVENNLTLDLNREMIADICCSLLVCIRGNATYTSIKNTDALLKLLDGATTALVEGYKTGNNVFDRVQIDTEAIEALRKEDFQKAA